MKTHFFFLVAACAMLASCSELLSPNATDTNRPGEQGGNDNGDATTLPMKYVKTITITTVYGLQYSPGVSSIKLDFKYDNQNRVVKYTKTYLERQNEYTIDEIDYAAKEGAILVTSWYSPTKKGDPLELTLGPDGLVSNIAGIYDVEHENGYMKSMGSSNEGLSCEYDKDWALVLYKESGRKDSAFSYKKKISAFDFINIDLNWLIIGGFPSGVLSPVLWGAFGKAGSLLLEQYPWNYNVPIPSSSEDQLDKTPGHHTAETFFSNIGDTADMSVLYDNDGYPTQLTYTVNVDEYKHSSYYDVDADGNINWGQDTEENIKTGKVLGTNDIVISITY